MIRRVVWSDEARDEMRAILSFVAETNPTYAAKLATLLRAAGDGLGRYDTGRPGRVPGMREKSATDIGYILGYSVGPSTDSIITILRVIHSRQNWPMNRWPRKPSSP